MEWKWQRGAGWLYIRQGNKTGEEERGQGMGNLSIRCWMNTKELNKIRQMRKSANGKN